MPSPDCFTKNSLIAHRVLRVVAALLCASVLFYAWNLNQVVQVALSASSKSNPASTLVLLGKRAPRAHIDRDFRARLDRVQDILDQNPSRALVISGGGPGKTEAVVAMEALSGGVYKKAWQLEQNSTSTWENLVNTRHLLANSETPVAIVSNRYHLARIQQMADSLDIPIELVAAEDHLVMSLSTCAALLREAAFLSVSKVLR